jgi:hypothetical protein
MKGILELNASTPSQDIQPSDSFNIAAVKKSTERNDLSRAYHDECINRYAEGRVH